MSKYRTITHRPNIDDVSLLLEEAINIQSYTQLRERATQLLGQPSRSRRLGVAGDVKRYFLDEGKKELNPSKSVLVRLWNSISSEKTRRELLYIEFVRHIKTADAFVQEVLIPKLSTPSEELFSTDDSEICKEEVEEFLNSKLSCSSSSLGKTRNHLLGMLGQFGILQVHGSSFSRRWTVRHYEPTVLGWLYAIYKEFDVLHERKRLEGYFANESPTTKRFLLSSDGLRYVMKEALKQGYLDKEIFGGKSVYRLVHPDTDTFVKEFIHG